MTERYEALSWEEAAALDDYTGVTVRIGDVRRPVMKMRALVHTRDDEGDEVGWSNQELQHWGAVIERRVPEHPHGVVRQEIGSVIRLGNGKLAVRVDNDEEPWQVLTGADSIPEWLSDRELQERADYHGFTPLGDVEAAREEGRKAGIRDAYRELDAGSAHRSMTFLRQAFPEAFEGADGESDD